MKLVRHTSLLLAPIFVAMPGVVFAARDLQTYIGAISGFLNNTLIPFFFAITILFLMVNVTRYFIIEGGDAAAKEKARIYIMYAVIGLVFITSLWGIINLVINGLGIGGTSIVCPDYNPNCNGQFGP